MEKSIKLVAFDMDGTVLDSKLRLPKGLFEMIESHPNVKFVVASGRQYYSLLNIFNPIKDKLIFISENGGIIMEKDKVIHIMPVPDAKALEVLDLVSEDKGIYPVLGCEKTSYIENPPEYVMNDVAQYNVRLETVDDIKSVVGKDNILNLALYCHKRAKDNILPKLADISGDLKAVLSAESWVDVINANVNKGNAIKVIQEIYGISPEECVAFGDYMNDYEMLQNCGSAGGAAALPIFALAEDIQPVRSGLIDKCCQRVRLRQIGVIGQPHIRQHRQVQIADSHGEYPRCRACVVQRRRGCMSVCGGRVAEGDDRRARWKAIT